MLEASMALGVEDQDAALAKLRPFRFKAVRAINGDFSLWLPTQGQVEEPGEVGAKIDGPARFLALC